LSKPKTKWSPQDRQTYRLLAKEKLSTASDDDDDDDVRMWGETNCFIASQSSFLKTTQNPNQHIMDTMKKTQTGVVTTKAWELQNTQQQNYSRPKTSPKHTHTHTHLHLENKQKSLTPKNKKKHTPQKNTPMKKKKRSLMREEEEEEDLPSFDKARRRRSKVPPWF
jgi:hypothetical protein